MANTSATSNERSFSIDKGKSSRAVCKICKKKCLLGEIRIAKYIPDFLGNGKKKNWHHVDCIFKQFLRQRLSTKRIKTSDDLDGWKDLSEGDRKMIQNKIKRSEEDMGRRNKKYDFKKVKKTKMKRILPRRGKITNIKYDTNEQSNESMLFKCFCDLVNDLINGSSYIEKFCTLFKVFKEANNMGIATENDLKLFCNLLLCDLESRKPCLQTKQLVKIFGKLLSIDSNKIINDTEIMNLSESISFYFAQSKKCKPANLNTLTLLEINEFLNELCSTSKEEDYARCIEDIVNKCTVDELKILICLIQNDLKINICLKYFLEVIHPDAHQLFQKTKMLDGVIDEYVTISDSKNSVNTKLSPMTIVLPVLTENCSSIEQALSTYPKGVFCEVNYEGERVQFHKKNSDFKYYSYSAQEPGCVEKITNLKNLIFEAFPYTNKLILDCEILPFNTKTGNLLPPHDPANISPDADVKHIVYCIVVIDCLLCDVDISRKPLRDRRDLLKRTMIQIPNLVILSEAKEVHREQDMNELVAKMIHLNVDGLILKDIEGIYAPSKKQWLKISKNFFVDNGTAVTVDLIVLGGWKDPNKKDDNVLSTFLMGCFDRERKQFCTIATVHAEKDDKYLENTPEKMNMVHVGCDDSKTPDWLCCSKETLPEFLAKDPHSQPVWKITALELLKDNSLSPVGIALRFPRITCKETGKNRRQVIDLTTLRKLHEESMNDVLSVGQEENSTTKTTTNKKKGVRAKGGQKTKRKIKNTSGTNAKKKLKKDQNKKDCTDDPIPTVENLPLNYFENVFLLLDDRVRNRHTQWVRSFVANGGTLVHDCHKNSATHVLHLYDEEPLEKMYHLRNGIHVIVEWIKDTLKEGALQDDRPYRVRLVAKEGT